MLCLGVFALELISTVLRRAVRGRSLLRGDRGHVYDRLADRLGNRERATAVMVMGGVVVAAIGWLVSRAQIGVASAVVASVAVAGWIAVGGLLGDPLRRSR